MNVSIGAWLCPYCHHVNRVLEDDVGLEESFIAECENCRKGSTVAVKFFIEYTAQKIEVEGGEKCIK